MRFIWKKLIITNCLIIQESPVLLYRILNMIYRGEKYFQNPQWVDAGSSSANISVHERTDYIVLSWSGRWRSALMLRRRWKPAPPPPSSLHRFSELPANPTKAHWVFFCGRREIHKVSDSSTLSDFTLYTAYAVYHALVYCWRLLTDKMDAWRESPVSSGCLWLTRHPQAPLQWQSVGNKQ